MHTVSRRAALAGLAFLALWPGPAGAQEQTLKIVFPFAAGGSTDAVARMLADHMDQAERAAMAITDPMKLYLTEDFREALAAHLDKRKPRPFRGR